MADWDKRAQSYFNSEDDFHRAQKLLERYKSYLASNLPYSTIEEEFFAELDDTSDYESALLDSAVRLFNSRLLDQGIDVHSASSIALPTNFNQKNVFRTQLQITEVPLSKAHNDFLTLQRTNWKSESNSEKSHLEAFNLLLGLTGDINTSELTKEHITNLAKIIINYPSNKNKKAKYRNLKVSDFLSFTTPEADKIKPNTINKHKGHIVLFLKYLKQNDYCQVELHTPLNQIKIKKGRAADERQVFSENDLRKIFNSKEYTQGLHKSAARFWVPLIALHTGARLNEICQLSVFDIHQNSPDNKWVFDFNENSDIPHKTLKLKIHTRLVPIHQQLIGMGFLDFVSERKLSAASLSTNQLFHELAYTTTANKYGEQIQKWFNNTYLKNCNIPKDRKSFHSLRHTVINQFSTKHKITENQISAGLGQSAQGGVFEKRYSKQHLYAAYSDFFDRLNFEDSIDFTLIKDWNMSGASNS